jgi:tetratricopeptide (TPR) repeat protein
VKWSISSENLDDGFSVTGAIGNPEEGIRTARQHTTVLPQHAKKIDSLEEAIEVFRQAVQTTPINLSSLQRGLISLENSIRSRNERMGQMEGLEEAIQIARQVVKGTPSAAASLGDFLNNLGNALSHRYERTGEIEDLEEAIQIARQVVENTSDDHPGLTGWLSNLGNSLRNRYQRTGQMESLEEGIRFSRQAVKRTPSDHPSLAALLNNLGVMFETRYQRTGRIEDLEEAIQIARQAVEGTPSDHHSIAAFSSNLGTLLDHRYQRTGQMESLEEGIRFSRQAVKRTPSDHPSLAALLNNLGVMLRNRYRRTGQTEDLNEAIQIARQVVKETPDDHLSRPSWLYNLGNSLGLRYVRTGRMEDLEEAIQVFRQAVQSTPDDHPDLARWLINLGNKLGSKYEQTGQMNDLEEAIQVARQAVEGIPSDHPDLTAGLINLGVMLGVRYERTGQMQDIEEAIRVCRQAVQIKSAPPFNRINAIVMALRPLLKREDYHGCYALSVEAINLLQLMHKRSLTVQDRQYVVSCFSGLATQACSLAIQTQQPLFEALRLLESGRGVILSLLMDDRSDTSKLKEAHPVLCARYESLRLEVNTPLESTKSQQTGEYISTRRPQAIEELERCIQDIRELPDLGSFQKGLSAEQIQSASRKGSIVVVNVTNLRSDAIIISVSGFSLVPLPRFEVVQAQRWVDQKLTSAGNNKSYRQFLTWLWRECVKPVLTELGYSAQPSPENLPRVWWIGTGLASSFPFHAACDVSAGENTFCRVLSSYTTSIKALIHARERVSISTKSNETTPKLLMVTMAKTPGANDLPGVKAEKSTVLGALGNSVHVEVLDQPDSSSVISQISKCNIAHFACHGTSNSRDPSQSGLLLQTATADPEQEILTVLKLCENHPTLGEIAYLSACSTAENRAEGLIDEGLHVVSGFQVAGFRHVIGTLWPSDDSVCVEVARLFYAKLCQNGALKYTDRAVAMALHKAVSDVSMRVEYRKRPLHWAQFVHYGA